jgi:hypothetical protein
MDQHRRRKTPVGSGFWFILVTLFAGPVVAALDSSVASAQGSAPRRDAFVVYAAPTTVQFMNHADDRIRGMSANPFTPSQKSLVLVANGSEKEAGPFPGDDVLYTFKLYHDSDFRKKAGIALFTCYYAFAKQATCEGYFEFGSSELVADGQITFGKSKFAFTVAGGTGADFGVRGQVLASGLRGQADAERFEFSLKPTGSTATKRSSLKIYSVADQVQYLNNADDEARGEINNPFQTATNKLRPALSWKGDGPFAGDVAVYSFSLYRDVALKKNDGTAIYICYFNYNKRSFCDTDFTLAGNGGTVDASGPVNFNSSGFSLIVTGGTWNHLGSRGQLVERSVLAKNAEQVTMSFA